MDVLDPQQHRALCPERRDQLEEGIEEAALDLAALGLRLAGRLPELGDQAGELGARHVGELLEDGVARSLQRAQRLHQWRVRELIVAELDAGAAEDAGVELAGEVDDLVQQPRLADPGLAREEDQRRVAAGGVAERPLELGELVAAADETGAADALGHASSVPPLPAVGAPPRSE